MIEFEQYAIWLSQISYLSEEDLALFHNKLNIKKIKKNEYILTEGQVCKELGFIISGGFRVFYISNEKEANVEFAFENQFIMDYDSFITNKPSKYYIQALESSALISFNQEALITAYDKSKNWERFGRIVTGMFFKRAMQRLESFLFMTGEERYHLLLEKEPKVLERVPLFHIASYLGIERESLSRIRKNISKARRK